MHEDFTRQHEVRAGSNRTFGWVMAGALTVAALTPLRHGLPPRTWALVAAAGLALVAALAPRVLGPFNAAWTRFGLLLNRVSSPVLLGAVYVLAVVPTGLVVRALGRDPMRRARDSQAASYWIERETGPGPMTRQF